MSREEGNLSRSVTTRAPANISRRKGPLRNSRDAKGSPLAPGHVDALAEVGKGPVPSIAVEGQPEGATQARPDGSGVGVGSGPIGGAKLQRRLGPSNRYALARGVSAPEMFSEIASFRKKTAIPNGDANGTEQGDAPGLLNTTGLKVAAGGEKSSKSPLRQSIMATAEEEENEEDEEDQEAKVDLLPVDEVPTTNGTETDTKAALEASEEVTTSVEVTTSEEATTLPNGEANGEVPNGAPNGDAPVEEVPVEEAPVESESGEWKAVSGAEFESSGKKLERRRKNRVSGTSQANLDVGLSAESVLQALREEGN